MKAKNIHSRINQRANASNKAKAFGMELPKEGLFYWSFNNDGLPRYEDLFRFERLGHYNNHQGFYN